MPNPWIAVPVVVSTVAGWIIGYFVIQASCAPNACTAGAVSIGLLAAAGAGGGVAVVAILAVRSIAEWREQADREITIPVDDPGPPTC